MNVRPALLAAALAALAACAHAPAPPAAAPARPARFTPYPDVEVAGWKNPHDYKGKALCQACHAPASGALRADPVTLCRGCHAFHHGNHPVDVVQKTGGDGLPLGEGRKVGCQTCHDPHDVKARKFGLRLAFNELCLRCHARH